MLPVQIGRFQGDEHKEHCRRVAMLASRSALSLHLGEEIKEGLVTAAGLHHDPVYFGADPPGDVAGQIMDRLILPDRPRDDEPGLAAETLDACNAFDEAVEFAAFEGLSPSEAIHSFYDESLAQFDPRVAEALRRATSPAGHIPRFEDLPVIPKIASALMRTSDEKTSPAQLAHIVAGDPVLCGRLIGAANSARYGSRHTIQRVNDAALRVGVPVARKILLSSCIGRLFASKPLQEIWAHAQTVAAAAFELARKTGPGGESAWLAGLLHDIGRLVLMGSTQESMVNLQEWLEGGFPLVYAETLTWGTDHACVGAQLLGSWGIPEEIVAAVADHHTPERGVTMASIVFLAEQWSAGAKREGLCLDLRKMAAYRNVGFTPGVLQEIDAESELFALAG